MRDETPYTGSTDSTEPQVTEGEVLDEEISKDALSIFLKKSVLTDSIIGIGITVGDGEHITDPEQAEQIALNLMRVAGYLRALQQMSQQSLAEKVMSTKLVGPNGSPLL